MTALNLFTLARKFDNLDHRKIAEWLAMNQPTYFVAACGAIADPAPVGHPQWMLDCPLVYRGYGGTGQFLIPLIKHIRENTGMGPREAMLVSRALIGVMSETQREDLQGWAMDEPRGHLKSIRAALGKHTF